MFKTFCIHLKHAIWCVLDANWRIESTTYAKTKVFRFCWIQRWWSHTCFVPLCQVFWRSVIVLSLLSRIVIHKDWNKLKIFNAFRGFFNYLLWIKCFRIIARLLFFTLGSIAMYNYKKLLLCTNTKWSVLFSSQLQFICFNYFHCFVLNIF